MNWLEHWKRKGVQPSVKADDDLDLHFTAIEFSSGTRISLRRDSILVLTGANNVGKSSTLTEVFDHMIEGMKLGPLLRSIEVHAAGSKAAFIEHMNLESLPVDALGFASIEGRSYRTSELEADLKKKLVGSRAAGAFIGHLTAIKRLEAANPSSRESRPEQSKSQFSGWNLTEQQNGSLARCLSEFSD